MKNEFKRFWLIHFLLLASIISSISFAVTGNWLTFVWSLYAGSWVSLSYYLLKQLLKKEREISDLYIKIFDITHKGD